MKMTAGDMIGKVYWERPETINGRCMLFCIQEKCMTGKVLRYAVVPGAENVKIEVAFIDKLYFKELLKEGERFTIQEASRVLAEGIMLTEW